MATTPPEGPTDAWRKTREGDGWADKSKDTLAHEVRLFDKLATRDLGQLAVELRKELDSRLDWVLANAEPAPKRAKTESSSQ